ncbi:hypothetical protein [Natronosalvus halobius]|uniref:hypothetical protein n=1 Tax=Natronosalvus halobius TaxID=2953746 RepID=UPI0020A01309|nr:hypothetical protein [Natronosalvus halobius]USZ72079.1 hypothetical protein NGM15_01850 [Natronosalvus halobius]
MARERSKRAIDNTLKSGKENSTANDIERRTYLKVLGSTAIAGGALLSSGTAAADSHDQDLIEIDYDEYYDPSSSYNGLGDVYDVWNQRSRTSPDITSSTSRTGETSCAHYLDGDQMSANTVYPFDDHYDTEVDELYQRFYVHPNGMWLSENNTMRFFWAGLRSEGDQDSGNFVTPPPFTGEDGWSVRLGFTRRENHDHPDTYTFFVYSYDARLTDSTTPYLEFGNRVQMPMNEWVKIETYQKLNTYTSSGSMNNDGVFRAWVNDELAYERENFAWRSADGNGIEYAGPHGYDLYQDNDPYTIYFDNHVMLVNGTREDWLNYDGGESGSGDDGDEEETDDTGDQNELAILTESGADRVRYRFVADGPVTATDLGTSPSGGSVSANGNDTITEREDGTYEVEGLTGNGWGDAFAIDGDIVTFEAENADADADPAFWLEWNGEEIAVDELVADKEEGTEDDTSGENELAILTEPGADRVRYRFVANGPVTVADLGTSPSGNPVSANGNDTITEREDGTYEIEGVTGNGWGDGFIIEGDIISFEAENADVDTDPAFWLEWNGEEIAVDDLTGENDEDDEPEPAEFAILTEPGADRVRYRFIANGPVTAADLGTSPSGNPISANDNDTITYYETGYYEVEGLTGNGWGDGFVVEGDIVTFEAENADTDADPAFWLEWDGEEVAADDL